nr:NOL1/NOP2/Sun family protein [Toxoplasma gondii TgCATBr9]
MNRGVLFAMAFDFLFGRGTVLGGGQCKRLVVSRLHAAKRANGALTSSGDTGGNGASAETPCARSTPQKRQRNSETAHADRRKKQRSRTSKTETEEGTEAACQEPKEGRETGGLQTMSPEAGDLFPRYLRVAVSRITLQEARRALEASLASSASSPPSSSSSRASFAVSVDPLLPSCGLRVSASAARFLLHHRFVREGLVALQDRASCLAALAAGIGPGDFVLDACAAPGSKTLHALDRLQGRGRLIALERDSKRAATLIRRLLLHGSLQGPYTDPRCRAPLRGSTVPVSAASRAPRDADSSNWRDSKTTKKEEPQPTIYDAYARYASQRPLFFTNVDMSSSSASSSCSSPCSLDSTGGRDSTGLPALLVEVRVTDFLSVSGSEPPFCFVEKMILDPSCSGSGLPLHISTGTRTAASPPRPQEDVPPLPPPSSFSSPPSPPSSPPSSPLSSSVSSPSPSCSFASFSPVPEMSRLSRLSPPPGSLARVRQLSRFQGTLLAHALTTFPKLSVCCYSTCSSYVEENEAVVARVLARLGGPAGASDGANTHAVSSDSETKPAGKETESAGTDDRGTKEEATEAAEEETNSGHWRLRRGGEVDLRWYPSLDLLRQMTLKLADEQGEGDGGQKPVEGREAGGEANVQQGHRLTSQSPKKRGGKTSRNGDNAELRGGEGCGESEAAAWRRALASLGSACIRSSPATHFCRGFFLARLERKVTGDPLPRQAIQGSQKGAANGFRQAGTKTVEGSGTGLSSPEYKRRETDETLVSRAVETQKKKGKKKASGSHAAFQKQRLKKGVIVGM